MPDDRVPDDRLSHHRLPDHRVSDHRLPDDWLSHHRMPDDRLPHHRLPDDPRNRRHRDSGMIVRRAALAVSIGCVGDTEPADTDTADVQGEIGPGAFDPGYATSDAFFTRMDGPVDGQSVHGTVQIWYSVNLEPLLGPSFTAPEGTVAIKVQDNGQPALTVMIKEPPGFDPENGDWSYEQRSPEGVLSNSGALPSCIGCHSGYPDTDFLAGTELE